MGKRLGAEMIGQKFNRLTVVSVFRVEDRLFANCACDCGNNKTGRMSTIKYGSIKSCGCLAREVLMRAGAANKRHGHAIDGSVTRAYRSWSGMKSRCGIPTIKSYADYGGRGIKVCNEWAKFENFLKDMGEPPPGMSLDRINTNGDYSKENCRWATAIEQAQNRRNARYVLYKGELVSLALVAREIGMNYDTLWGRVVLRGWPIDKAISTKACSHV